MNFEQVIPNQRSTKNKPVKVSFTKSKESMYANVFLSSHFLENTMSWTPDVQISIHIDTENKGNWMIKNEPSAAQDVSAKCFKLTKSGSYFKVKFRCPDYPLSKEQMKCRVVDYTIDSDHFFIHNKKTTGE